MKQVAALRAATLARSCRRAPAPPPPGSLACDRPAGPLLKRSKRLQAPIAGSGGLLVGRCAASRNRLADGPAGEQGERVVTGCAGLGEVGDQAGAGSWFEGH